MAQPTPPLPQEIAGRYLVESRLGAGAFGTVYKAKDKLLGRRVAIKTIRLDGLVATQTALEELVERFQREARVSAQLRHPSIVTIYDVGEADGAHYLAMEFIDGTGLDRLIAGERRLPVGRAAAICAQVADALHYAHEQGVVHRDIKPANIMIEPGDRVKVADFGIAKVKDAGEQQLTATGSLLGTPSYMSPEQARGQHLDGRSDLFSLGCVLYEMLKGRKAFQGDSITALLFKIIAEEPPPLRDDDPEIPDAIEAIVKKALAKSPADRFASGHELAEALLAVAAPGSVATLKSAAAAVSPTRVLPTPDTATVATDAPTAFTDSAPTAVGPAPTQGRPTPLPPAPPPPPPPPQARRAAGAVAPPARASAAATPARVPALVLGLLAVGAIGLLAMVGGGAYWFFGRDTSEPVNTAVTDPRPVVTPPAAAAATADAEAPAPGDAEPAAEAEAPAAVPLPTSGPRSAEARPATREPEPARPTALAPAASSGAPAVTGSGFEHLDDEARGGGVDDGDTGRRVAEAFRSGRSGSANPGGRFTRRARSPQDLKAPERPAVATLRHLINIQDVYARREGRYGSLAELKAAGLLRLDVPLQLGSFQRRGYRFELQLGEEEFQIRAAPLAPGLRAFAGDESGLIREPDED